MGALTCSLQLTYAFTSQNTRPKPLTAPSAVHLTGCFLPDSQQYGLSVEAYLPLSPHQRFLYSPVKWIITSDIPSVNRIFAGLAVQKKQGRSNLPCVASKPVSRVLSFKTAIYLDVPLPTRSSRLPGTAGPAVCPSTALLRIEFTAMDAFTRHWVSSYLTFPPLPHRRTTSCRWVRAGPRYGERRYISVALFLGSPPAGVTRYPCPVEPGLSSQAGLSPRPRGCPACLPEHHTGKAGGCQMDFDSCLGCTLQNSEFLLH